MKLRDITFVVVITCTIITALPFAIGLIVLDYLDNNEDGDK